MREIVASITSKGQLTIPAAVRRHLGVEPGGKVAFVIEDGSVRLQPTRFTLETVFGSVEPLDREDPDDFDAQIEEAMEDGAAEIVRKLSRP